MTIQPSAGDQTTRRDPAGQPPRRPTGARPFLARAVWIVLTALCTALVIFGIPDRLEQLTLGAPGLVLGQNQAGEIVIAGLVPGSSAARAHIHEGDLLIAIGGAPVQPGAPVEEIQARLQGKIGTPIALSVRDQAGQTHSYILIHSEDLAQALERLGLSVDGYARYTVILDALTALGFLVVGLVVFRRRLDPLGLIVSLTLVTFGATDVRLYDQDWRLLFESLQALSEILTFLVFTLFPDGHFYPRWSRALGILCVVWVITVHALHPIMPPEHLIVTLALWMGGMVGQIRRYRRASDPTRRQQTKWVVWGLSIVFVIYFAYAFNDVWNLCARISWLGESGRYQILNLTVIYPIRRLGLLVAPLALAVAILRYRLWDIDIVINRSLVYGMLTALLAVLFAGTLLAISQPLQVLTGGQQSIVAIAITAIAFGVLFQPARRSLQRFVDRRFYHIQIDYHKKPAPPTASLDASPHFRAYTGLELVGRGGMSKVYRAQHPTLKRPVAIKILAEHLGQESDFRRRFEREAQTVAALRHPNIVQVFEFGETENIYYMVMEYIAGPNLSAFLDKTGRLSIQQALPLLCDVASALDHAHERGLIHRDIKPSNVMLDPLPAAGGQEAGFRAVLMDFGLVKIVGGSAYMTQAAVLGTFSYIAPEQIRAADDVDRRADVYALGVMAYRMLTGELPFKQQHPSALLIAHLSQPPPNPREQVPNLPAGVTDAMQRAMAKRPEERYPTAGAFAQALEAAAAP